MTLSKRDRRKREKFLRHLKQKPMQVVGDHQNNLEDKNNFLEKVEEENKNMFRLKDIFTKGGGGY